MVSSAAVLNHDNIMGVPTGWIIPNLLGPLHHICRSLSFSTRIAALEKQCASQPSRLSSNASRPKNSSPRLKVSIWGKLDLKQHDNAPVDLEMADAPISDSDEGRH
jgi:hypothetical protein